MRLGLIGPRPSTELLIEQTLNKYPYIDIIPLNYKYFTDTLEIVQREEQNFDALLFTGQTPYRYVSNFLSPQIAWEYIPRNHLAICATLMQAHAYYKPNGNTLVSLDNFDNTILNQVQQEYRSNKLNFQFFNTKFDILEPDYLNKIISSHLYNYHEHNAAFCITGIQDVYDRLKAKNIPVFKIMPSVQAFQEKLHILSIKDSLHQEKIADKLAVIAIEFEFAKSDNFNSELFQLKQTMQALEAISYFASHTGAAIFQAGPNQYFLTLSSNTLLLETDNLRHISLLNSIMDMSIADGVSIGIGIATTAYSAKMLAQQASKHAHLQSGFCCYALNDNNELIGPLYLECKKSQSFHDNDLNAIANKTGVSLQNIKTIWQIMFQYNIDTITSTELAHYCNLSTRTINRILEKLVDHGYAQITGKQAAPNGKGRPGRTIKFNF